MIGSNNETCFSFLSSFTNLLFINNSIPSKTPCLDNQASKKQFFKEKEKKKRCAKEQNKTKPKPPSGSSGPPRRWGAAETIQYGASCAVRERRYIAKPTKRICAESATSRFTARISWRCGTCGACCATRARATRNAIYWERPWKLCFRVL